MYRSPREAYGDELGVPSHGHGGGMREYMARIPGVAVEAIAGGRGGATATAQAQALAEGGDTADADDAAALLDELGAAAGEGGGGAPRPHQLYRLSARAREIEAAKREVRSRSSAESSRRRNVGRGVASREGARATRAIAKKRQRGHDDLNVGRGASKA